MKQDMYMLPVRCKGCNVMFDLWPILQEQEKASQGVLVENHFAKLLNQSFCPNCRQAVLLGMADKQEELGEVEGDEEDQLEEVLEDGFEMMLELE
ncbi:MAG: hypothetical protein ABH864_00370 [archaeon]